MANTLVRYRANIVSGIWKFSSAISISTLTNLAEEWKSEEPENYLDLHVRQCSQGQAGICFQYAANGRPSKRFFHEVTDKLKRRFGNDFIGWDVGYGISIINLKKDSLDLDTFQQEVEKLLGLLNDRQRGLMTWNEMFSDRLKNVGKLISTTVEISD